ncbi:MAG: diguanylate cyclase [Litoreibacter sp.]|nr:diguanylate cyclase [Litoreibacter sp.]
MGRRILIIDAMPTRRIVMKAKLGAARYEVLMAADMEEAEPILAKGACDIIMLDTVAGADEEDTRQTCRDLKARAETSDIPVLMMCQTPSQLRVIQALEAGFDDILLRPVDEAALMAQLRAVLRRKSARAEHPDRDFMIEFQSQTVPAAEHSRIAVVASSRPKARAQAALLRSATEPDAKTEYVAHDFTSIMALDGKTPDIDAAVVFSDMFLEDVMLTLLSDMRSGQTLRHTGIVAAMRVDDGQLVARAFDLGAENVVSDEAGPAELAWRAQALAACKKNDDAVRRNLENGLKLAMTDPLTGLFNRRFAARRLNQITAEYEEYALLMLDIDHFKRINDTYGHSIGDKVLMHVADTLRNDLRQDDLLARVGGEEFMIALPGISRDLAMSTAERLRHAINTTPTAERASGKLIKATVSIGLIHCDQEHADVEALMHRADRALYDAKAAGRNKVRVSQAT